MIRVFFFPERMYLIADWAYLYLVVGIHRGFAIRMSNDYGVHKKAEQEVLLRQTAKQERDYVWNDRDQASEGSALLRTSTI